MVRPVDYAATFPAECSVLISAAWAWKTVQRRTRRLQALSWGTPEGSKGDEEMGSWWTTGPGRREYSGGATQHFFRDGSYIRRVRAARLVLPAVGAFREQRQQAQCPPKPEPCEVVHSTGVYTVPWHSAPKMPP